MLHRSWGKNEFLKSVCTHTRMHTHTHTHSVSEVWCVSSLNILCLILIPASWALRTPCCHSYITSLLPWPISKKLIYWNLMVCFCFIIHCNLYHWSHARAHTRTCFVSIITSFISSGPRADECTSYLFLTSYYSLCIFGLNDSNRLYF